MPTREEIVDRMRAELARQEAKDRFTLNYSETPDVAVIHGEVDLLALAAAVLMK